MSKKKIVVGIDIGGTNTVFGLVDRDGKILSEGQIKTREFDESQVFVAALIEKIRLAVNRLNNSISIH